MTETAPKSHRSSKRTPRKGAWKPHFLGFEDYRTDEDRRRLARRLEAEMRKDDAERATLEPKRKQ